MFFKTGINDILYDCLQDLVIEEQGRNFLLIFLTIDIAIILVVILILL